MENEEELHKMNNQILRFMKRVTKKYSQYEEECKTICWSCEKTSKALISIRIKEAKTPKQNDHETI